MPIAPVVLVTATTASKAGVSRVLVHEAYTSALVDAGLIPLVLPPVDAELAAAALTDIGGLVLTGGEDIDPRLFGQERHPASGDPHEARDACEIALVKTARERRIPTLAICRGPQILNVALGGTLIQDIPEDHPKSLHRIHTVEIDAGSRLASILGDTTIVINSTHHQAIDRLGDGLKVVGRSRDGIIEAAEPTDPAWWMIAVQWHAEELTKTLEDWDRRLYAAFADEVAKRR